MDSVRGIAPTGVRLPEDLKQWLKGRAESNLRSLNSEIVAMLMEARRNLEQVPDGSGSIAKR